MTGHSSSLLKPERHRYFGALKESTSACLQAGIVVGSLTLLLTFCIYLITIAPDLTWSHFSSDGGELITAAVTLGIPHPPGYPTYTLLGKLISFIPVRTVAFRFNAFSALCASVAAAFASAAAFENIKSAKAASSVALATGLSFALAPLVWGQATVTEVYTLNLAFMAAFLWALLGRRSSILTGTLLGLTLTTHLTSILLIPLAFVLTRNGYRRQLFAGMILGLLPLAVLPILARQGSPVLWGDPATLSGWIWLVSGRLYMANLNLPENIEFVQRLSTWSKVLLNQFAILGWLFVVIGVAIVKQESRQVVWLLITAAIFTVFSFAYGTSDAILFLMPVLLLLSSILAVGLSAIGRWSLILPLALLLINFNNQNLRDDLSVRPLVENLFDELPQEALILTPGDQSIFTLWYFTHVEWQRTDLILVDSNLFAFDWYREKLIRDHPTLKGLGRDDLNKFQTLNAQDRPVCSLSLRSPDAYTCSSEWKTRASNSR